MKSEASGLGLPAAYRRTPIDDRGDWRDIAERQGAGNKNRLSSFIAAKIGEFPKGLTGEQLKFLYRMRQTDDAKRIQNLPSSTEEEKLNKTRAERGFLRQIRNAQVGDQYLFPPTDEFDAVFAQSATIDQVVVNCNLRLVVHLAYRYHNPRLDGHMALEDKLQAGLAFSQRAVESFDPERGFTFSTYAVPVISRGIVETIMSEDTAIRLPLAALKLVRDVAEEYRKKHNAQPTQDQWVDALVKRVPGLDPKDARYHVGIASGVMQFIRSTDEPASIDNPGQSLGDTLENPVPPSTEFSEPVRRVLAHLSDQEREIISVRFEQGLSVSQTAERTGINRFTISGVEQRIFNRLAAEPEIHVLVDRQYEGSDPSEQTDEIELTETGTNDTETRWEEKRRAIRIYNRIFNDPRMSRHDTRAAAVTDAIAEIQGIASKSVKTQLLSLMVRNIGTDFQETRQQAELSILENANFEGVSPGAIVDTYINRVSTQQPGTTPDLLLDVGMILATKMPIDDRMRTKTQQAWGKVMRREHRTDPRWDSVPGRVKSIITEIKRKEAPDVAVISEFLGDRIDEFYAWHPDVNTRDKRYYGVRLDAQVRIEELSDEDATSLTLKLIEGIGQQKGSKDVNRRDVAIELLQYIDFAKVDMEEVQRTYFDALRNVPEGSDPLGGVYSLIEAGQIIVPKLTPTKETRDGFNAAINSVSHHVAQTKEWVSMWGMVNALSNHDIIHRWTKGESAVTIGLMYGISRDGVYKIIERLREAGVEIPVREKVWHRTAGMPELSEHEMELVAVYEAAKTRLIPDTPKEMVPEIKAEIVAARRVLATALKGRGVPLRQIAQALGIPIKTVKNDVYTKEDAKKGAGKNDTSVPESQGELQEAQQKVSTVPRGDVFVGQEHTGEIPDGEGLPDARQQVRGLDWADGSGAWVVEAHRTEPDAQSLRYTPKVHLAGSGGEVQQIYSPNETSDKQENNRDSR